MNQMLSRSGRQNGRQQNADRATGPAVGLNRGQVLAMVAMGAALWFVAALLLRWLGPLGVYDGSAWILLYAAIIPGTVPFIYLIRWLGGLRGWALPLGVGVADATALMLDGVAIAWAPTLYGDAAGEVLGASATILWGAGVFLVLGFLLRSPDACAGDGAGSLEGAGQ